MIASVFGISVVFVAGVSLIFMALLQGCTLQELSCDLPAQTGITEPSQKMERAKASKHMSNLIEGALQQQSAHVASVTGADTSWPSVWHE